MKKPDPFRLRLVGSFALSIAFLWDACSRAQWAGNPTDATGPAAPGVTPKAAVLQPGWRPLLDEKLTSWEVWLGTPQPTVAGLPPGTPTSASGRDGTPLGLNNDPTHVFSVRMEDGDPVLHITGEILGGLTTLESFSNYHLRAQFKWGEPKSGPGAKNSHTTGILYDCTGPHGVFWKAWKCCFKIQVSGTNTGDLFALGGTCAEARVAHAARLWVWDPAGETNKFTERKLPGASGANRVVHAPGDFEKPRGEWNTLEIYTLGRAAVHVVNGHVVVAIQNAGTIEGPDMTEKPLAGGQIQLQSEDGEAFFRRVEIEPITELPGPIKQAAGL